MYLPAVVSSHLPARSAAMENPAFTAELDVSQGSSYGRFVSGVRDQLVLYAGASRHLDLVLLQTQEQDPKKAPWFGVTLRCGTGESVLLRVRADNLYISAYLQSPPAGRWWEFKGDPVIVHTTATQLAFSDNYGDIIKAANVSLEEVTLGKEQLENAVLQLAKASAGSQREIIARSLMVIVVMISEAIRFRSVAGVLGHMMTRSTAQDPLPAHMVEQVKNWSSLSEYWLGAVLYGQRFLPRIEAEESQLHRHGGHIPRHLLAPLKIDCQDHAMMALGVALNRQRPLEDEHRQALDEYWRAVRAQARRLDRARD
ncbi:hypothetical protein QOZ80_5AG0375470 [Eleusine coracana subsp. coracana]|nr:hypothetical protein QOZ80_5AG0375470 [Eleusine coracana subsp. coracana]